MAGKIHKDIDLVLVDLLGGRRVVELTDFSPLVRDRFQVFGLGIRFVKGADIGLTENFERLSVVGLDYRGDEARH